MNVGLIIVPIGWLLMGWTLYGAELGIVAALVSFILSAAVFLGMRSFGWRYASQISIFVGLAAPAIISAAIMMYFFQTVPPCDGDSCVATIQIATP